MMCQPQPMQPVCKALRDYKVDDCCDFLCSLKLDKYVPIFRERKIDGLLLTNLAHPQFGDILLKEMGITDKNDKDAITNAVKQHSM